MPSACGRYVIVFNGEDLQSSGTPCPARTASPGGGIPDTETLLACFSVWGMEKTLSNITGMFSLTLFDKETSKIFLIRDRLGEKPLYYGWQETASPAVFLRGKVSDRTPRVPKEIGRDGSLAAFLRFGYCPTPNSIYKV
ncbi:hypothetical protein ACPA9J_05540 [Pseudomonas aeruginosa]